MVGRNATTSRNKSCGVHCWDAPFQPSESSEPALTVVERIIQYATVTSANSSQKQSGRREGSHKHR